MLIEQAFFNLPEILVGSRFPTQDYEGGVVAAFSMAVLQELNGRNANNPISHLIAERIYQIDRVVGKSGMLFLHQTKPFTDGSGKPRYLRADLHVSLKNLRTGSAALARYGWRHSNWIEAKFFRDSYDGHSPTKPANGGALAADLLRLVSLPPVEQPYKKGVAPWVKDTPPLVKRPQIYTGRYLLHVYQGDPTNYHAIRRNKTRSKPSGTRKWLEALLSDGPQRIETLDLASEADTFMAPLNSALSEVLLEAAVTNFVVRPLHSKQREDSYWCILTRVDSFKLSFGSDTWEVGNDQNGVESSGGAAERIRRHVGNHVHAKEKVEEESPKQGDLNAEDAAAEIATESEDEVQGAVVASPENP